MLRGLRFSNLLLAGTLLASGGSAALAQNSVVAPPPPPREGTVGPEQLRDFSLGNSNTQRSEPTQPPAREQGPAPATSGERATAAPAPQRRAAPAPAPVPSGQAAPAARAQDQTVQPGPLTATPSRKAAPDVSLALPPAVPPPTSSFEFNAPGGRTAPAPLRPAVPAGDAGESGSPLWPWLLALAAVLAGALFLWSRRRSEAAYAVEDGSLAFAGGAPLAREPEPAPPLPRAVVPEPKPAPAAAAPAHPKGVGIVSTRLRPWLDVDVQVASAVLTEEELQLHLQLLLVNSGTVPARQVGAEVVALNAGPEQERDLASYFGRPDPEPRAAEMIAPLDQAVLQTVVRMPRSAFREYAAGEGRVLVPLVALNVSYRAGSNIGRTSAAFLIGRSAQGNDRLGPLRTDGGGREFRGTVARRLPDGVRR